MKFRVLFPLLFLFWQCASPPHAPLPSNNDDHRSVTRAEFAASPWRPLPAVQSWRTVPSGAAIALADGREVFLTFPTPAVVRWWVPAGPAEEPLSPGARYPERGAAVAVTEAGGVLSLDSPAFGARLKLADLSLTLVRGDTAVVQIGSPRMAGRRLRQTFTGDTWFGPGLETGSAKYWISTDPDTAGPWATPFLYGLGAVPFGIALDSSYQTYSRVTASEASLGALNGGLDLLIASSPQPEAVVEALTTLTGRPRLVPGSAAETAVVLPDGETGVFLRRAGIAVGAAVGTGERQTFRPIVVGPAPRAELNTEASRQSWAAWASPGSSLALPAYTGSSAWALNIDGRPLASMNNLIPTLEARSLVESGTPFSIVTGSAGPGTVRWAVPQLEADTRALPRMLSLGLAGQGTPAVRLDLSGLGAAESREAAFRALLSWLMAPQLTLDLGSNPAGLWQSLSDSEKARLKTLLDIRASFQPLLAQLARQTSATGVPAWRPVWFTRTRDTQALTTDEFLVGDLLAAPVSDAPKRKVYLPGPGVWFDFWTGEEFGGGRSYEVDIKADRPLLFARGGAMVPTRDGRNYENEHWSPLVMHVFPGGRGEGEYYADDGSGKPGTFFEARLLFDYSQRQMTLEHQTVAQGSPPSAEPYLLYVLHNVYRPRQVAIDGKAIPLYGPSWGVTESDRSAAWYEDDRSLLVKTFRPQRNQLIQMSF